MKNDKELAQITSKLQVPGVISDILDGKTEFDEATQYALHDLISELSPDSALLAIAIVSKQISMRSQDSAETLKIMQIQADRIIEEYGPLWLRASDNDTFLDNSIVMDQLAHVPEDLEDFAEFLQFCSDFTFADDHTAAEICTTLHIQATAHAMVAETFIEHAEKTRRDVEIACEQRMVERLSVFEKMKPANTPAQTLTANAPANGNVIMFPGAPEPAFT